MPHFLRYQLLRYRLVHLCLFLTLLISTARSERSISSAVFTGTLVKSATEASLQKGGDTLRINLGKFYDEWAPGLTDRELAIMLRGALTSSCKDRTSAWKANVATIVCDTCAKKTSVNTAMVTLAAAPGYSITHPERISLSIPGMALKSHIDRPGGDLYIMPDERLSFSVWPEGNAFAGKTTQVRFSGSHLSSLGDGISIVVGDNCNAPQALVRKGSPHWDTNTSLFQVVFLNGGTYSLCYRPTVPEDEQKAVLKAHPWKRSQLPLVQAQGHIVVDGPENAYNTDPAVVTTGTEFSVTFFGTNLTEKDHVVITPKSECPQKESEIDQFTLDLSGSGKAFTWARLPLAQTYRVCYWLNGTDSYVPLRDLRVQMGGGVLVSDSQQVLTVTEDTRITDNLMFDFLNIQAGTLNTDHYTLNVTHLDFRGGVITGKGSISTFGRSSIVMQDTARHSLETTIKNFGVLTIHVNQLDFGDGGVIHNYGVINIIVNDTHSDSAITGHFHSLIHNDGLGIVHFSRLSTTKNKAVTSHELRTTARLDIGILVINDGKIVVEQSLDVRFENMRSSKARAVLNVQSDSTVHVSGVLTGSFFLDNSTLIFSKSFVLNEGTKIVGISSKQSSLLMNAAASSASLINAKFDGSLSVTFDSGNFTFHGLSIFFSNVTVLFRAGFYQASAIARINVQGTILMNVQDVTIGSGVVISAANRAVFFGPGVGASALTGMSNKPANDSATLVVPKNATLLLLNLPDDMRSNAHYAVPSACTDYLIIPMHVEISGEVLLYGCALFPSGGDHSGIARSVADDASLLFSDLLNVAVCQSVFLGKSVCTPLPLALPDRDSVVSGYTLHGHHVMNSNYLSMHHLNVNGLVEFTGQVAVSLSGNFTVGPDGLAVFHTGGRVHSGNTHVFGGLDARSADPVILDGALTVYKGGKVGVNVGASDTCASPLLQINGTADFRSETSLMCNGGLRDPNASTYPVLGYHSMKGFPNLNNCNNMEAIKYPTVTELRGQKLPNISSTAFNVGVFLTVTTVVLLLGVLLRQSGSLSGLRREIILRPPFPVRISLNEISAFTHNYLNMVCMIVEAFCLMTPAFHPMVPVPNWVHDLYWVGIIKSKGAHYYIPLAVSVALWGIAWAPLLFRRTVLHLKRVSASGKSGTRVFMQCHATLHWVFTLTFFGVCHVLVLPFAQYLELTTTSHIADHWTVLVVAGFILHLFVLLVPYSGGNHDFPFAHPPCQRDSDLRLKRSFVYLQTIVFVLQVAATNLYDSDVTRLLVCALCVDAAMFLLHFHSAPCAYENGNQARGALYLFVTLVTGLSLFQVSLHGPHTPSSCAPLDVQYYGLLALTLFAVAIATHFVHLTSQSTESRLSVDDHALESNQMWQSALRKVNEAIATQKAQFFDSSPAMQRNLWASLAALKGEYHTTLSAYRAFKEQYYAVFYLAKTATSSVGDDEMEIEFSGGKELIEMRSPPGKNLPSPLLESHSALPQSLTPEIVFSQPDLDTCKRGPVIGRGNFGTVYMGMISVRGAPRLVAIKEISLLPGQSRDKEVAALKSEVALLRTLAHPNVIRYYGTTVTESTMSVFMEFAVGGSLTSLSKRFKKLHMSVIRLYTREILQGLTYLHQHKIVHRDIKGENILIDGEGHVRLADFGCSKYLGRTNPTGGVGSPYFMAPEVIRNMPYGTKADIWSVGCTVVEMLNGGSAPWAEQFDNVYTAMMFIGCHEGVPTNVPSNLMPQCRDFLDKCFHRDPEQRWSAEQLLRHPWVAELNEYEPHTRSFIENEKQIVSAAQSASSTMTWGTDTSSHVGSLDSPGAEDSDPLLKKRTNK